MRVGAGDCAVPAFPACSDASSLAWEVLRRDKAYRAAYAARVGQPDPVMIDPAFATRWGLHFP